jgi:threonine aldolase
LAVNHPVETNIVIVTVAAKDEDAALLAHLEAEGVLAVGFGPGRVRLIPNLDTSPSDVEQAVVALNSWNQ